MQISAAMVKELRERSGSGFMQCKEALVQTQGDMEKSIEYLRRKGMAAAERRAERKTDQGRIESYIHAGARIGVLVEVQCETDFVANTDDFKDLAKELAMQVAASSPDYVARDDIPEGVLDRERDILREQAADTGKPPQVVEKIVEGRLRKFFERVCLVDQAYIRDPDKKVADLIKETIARLGENIRVSRFARFQIGTE